MFLPLFVCVSVFVTPLNLGQHPEASGRFGQGENSFWKFPPSLQHMDSCLHSTSPIIPHSIPSSIKLHTPPTSTLWLLRRAQSTTVITIKHTPFALTHVALVQAPKPPHRHLHSFSCCLRLISSCSILKLKDLLTSTHAWFYLHLVGWQDRAEM